MCGRFPAAFHSKDEWAVRIQMHFAIALTRVSAQVGIPLPNATLPTFSVGMRLVVKRAMPVRDGVETTSQILARLTPHQPCAACVLSLHVE